MVIPAELASAKCITMFFVLFIVCFSTYLFIYLLICLFANCFYFFIVFLTGPRDACADYMTASSMLSNPILQDTDVEWSSMVKRRDHDDWYTVLTYPANDD